MARQVAINTLPSTLSGYFYAISSRTLNSFNWAYIMLYISIGVNSSPPNEVY